MKVNSVTVCNFRNYGDFSVSFDSGINVLCGKNGIGKTNLLEGIFLFAGGKSFRGAKDREAFQGTKKAAFQKRLSGHTAFRISRSVPCGGVHTRSHGSREGRSRKQKTLS